MQKRRGENIMAKEAYIVFTSNDGVATKIKIESCLGVGRNRTIRPYINVVAWAGGEKTSPRPSDRDPRIEKKTGVMDKSVSGNHAEFFWKNGKLWVKDIGSKNGTWLDGCSLPGWKKSNPSEAVEIKGAATLILGTSTFVRVENSMDSVNMDFPVGILSKEELKVAQKAYPKDELNIIAEDGDLTLVSKKEPLSEKGPTAKYYLTLLVRINLLKGVMTKGKGPLLDITQDLIMKISEDPALARKKAISDLTSTLSIYVQYATQNNSERNAIKKDILESIEEVQELIHDRVVKLGHLSENGDNVCS